MWGLNITTLCAQERIRNFRNARTKTGPIMEYYPPGYNIQVVVGTSPKNSFRSPGTERNSVAECSLSVSGLLSTADDG